MDYWDTSALLKLYAPEPDSPRFLELAATSGGALGTADVAAVELICSLERKERAGDLREGGAEVLFQRFETDVQAGRIVLVPYGREVWSEVKRLVDAAYRHRGKQVVMVRSLDAIHIGTALSMKVASLIATDKRLRQAAALVGLKLAPGTLD